MSDTATAHEKAQLLLKLEFAPMYWCSSFGYNAHALKCRYHVYHLDSHPKASLLQSGLLFYASHRPDDPLQLLTNSGPPFYQSMLSVNFDGTDKSPKDTTTILWELYDE